MIENKKVAGILLETIHHEKDFRIGLIVGVGVNLSAPSLETKFNAPYGTSYVAKFLTTQIDKNSFFDNFQKELIKLESYIEEKSNLNFKNMGKKKLRQRNRS